MRKPARRTIPFAPSRTQAMFGLAVLLSVSACSHGDVSAATTHADEADGPRYRPSGRSKQTLPIDSNAYGAFGSAPSALGIGDVAPSFELPASNDEKFSFGTARTEGPVIVVFYRGFW